MSGIFLTTTFLTLLGDKTIAVSYKKQFQSSSLLVQTYTITILHFRFRFTFPPFTMYGISNKILHLTLGVKKKMANGDGKTATHRSMIRSNHYYFGSNLKSVQMYQQGTGQTAPSPEEPSADALQGMGQSVPPLVDTPASHFGLLPK